MRSVYSHVFSNLYNPPSPDKLVQSSFTDAVPKHSREGPGAGDTGDVDDVPSAGGEVGGGQLGQQECGPEIFISIYLLLLVAEATIKIVGLSH